ncbi:hypothetical protein [Streptomyces laurentii]|uniref:hypothetical protein n=1 Tax=Streptomyces laurentii TaxID=39478 RepID=UPI003410C93E
MADGQEWRVRQGGPIALWDRVEGALIAWEAAGSPDITAVRLRVTQATHRYWIEGEPRTIWEHHLD